MRHDLTARGDNRALVRDQNGRVDVSVDGNQGAVVCDGLTVVCDDECGVYILPHSVSDASDEARPPGEADAHSESLEMTSAIFSRTSEASQPWNGRLPTTRWYSALSAVISSCSSGSAAR